jgi:ABC-type uncharacterized transport system ATPase subunit
MLWQGEKMVLSGPSEARSRGIGMVFQHFSLFDNLTVAENVALGLDGKESFKDMSARLEEVSNVYGLPTGRTEPFSRPARASRPHSAGPVRRWF